MEVARRVERRKRIIWIRTAALAVAACACLVSVQSTSAYTALPHLTLHALNIPTSFSSADSLQCDKQINAVEAPLCDSLHVRVTESGDGVSNAPTVISDTVPTGLSIKQVQLFWSQSHGYHDFGTAEEEICETQAQVVTCRFPLGLPRDASLELVVNVDVEPGVTSVSQNVTSATAAGSPEASSSQNVTIGSSPGFGISALSAEITGGEGEPETQAGAHPYELTTRIDLNNDIRRGPTKEETATSVQDVKDIVVDLPVGVLGDALSAPQCSLSQLESVAGCSPSTRVGNIVTLPSGLAAINGGVYNLVPEHGHVAEFGFIDNLETPHVLYASLAPTESGYVVSAKSSDIGQINLTNIVATFYGNPAQRSLEANGFTSNGQTAMFTNPSYCSGKPLITKLYADSWQNPGRQTASGFPDLSDPNWASSTSESPPVTGCNSLRFATEVFSVQPDTSTADQPTGLNFDLKVAQNEAPGTLSTPPLKDATVTLPPGLIVNPSAAGGLATCSISQIGWLGHSLSDFNSEAPSCPDASKIGSVEIETPLLQSKLDGSIYLATQNENPFHSLLAGYIVVADEATGVLVKIPGKLSLNPSTGQITGLFNENPQLPFSNLNLRFFGGTRGELATPESCGTYTTSGVFEPWSAPDSGPSAQASNAFQVNSGCSAGFAPTFSAGTTNPQAGSYTPFVLSFNRQDTDQEISSLSASLPPGLEGKLAGITECSEAEILEAQHDTSGLHQREDPSCPANSQIGTVETSAGVGTQPYTLSGNAYLTGPYKGSPYGVAVVVPAVAGPFDLGTVVVRSSLQINSTDAHVTVQSDPLPTIVDQAGADGGVDGFPIRLRSVSITMDRPGFTLNPTNCTPLAINGAVVSTSGATYPVSSRFQAAGCRGLGFNPGFAVSTQARTSKANGASLHVHVTSGAGQANIAKVKVALPRQLPSRLSTLQKACLASVFSANPSLCPPGSLVGTGAARTPLLGTPLTGPAYLVSHGGAAFPDLEVVLQGNGITLILDGNTNIKRGITTSTFNAVPDAPVSSFSLTLPEGPHSVLAAYLPPKARFSMCGQGLVMPTTIVGQNGAVIQKTTKVSVPGCPLEKSKTGHKRRQRKK